MSNSLSRQNIDEDKNKTTEAVDNVNGSRVMCLEETFEQMVGPLSLTTIPSSKRQVVSNDDRERIVAKTLEGHSVPAISSMYQINYQNVNSIIKQYLKTGLIFDGKRGEDRRLKLTLEVKENLLAYVDLECIKTLHKMAEWIKSTFNIEVLTSTVDRVLREFHYTLKRVTLVPELRNSVSTV